MSKPTPKMKSNESQQVSEEAMYEHFLDPKAVLAHIDQLYIAESKLDEGKKREGLKQLRCDAGNHLLSLIGKDHRPEISLLLKKRDAVHDSKCFLNDVTAAVDGGIENYSTIQRYCKIARTMRRELTPYLEDSPDLIENWAKIIDILDNTAFKFTLAKGGPEAWLLHLSYGIGRLNRFLNWKTINIAICLLIIFLAKFVFANPEEKVFASALEYTVKIKTTIKYPFSIGLGNDERGTAFGAGFVVDSKRGWIVTNAHVTGSSPGIIEVAFHDSNWVSAEKVYVDPFIDLAILRIDAKNRSQAELDCKGEAKTGTMVGAYGHPHKAFFTGTKGIISGISSDLQEGVGEYYQIDTPINPGNSGGPVISFSSGRVVGIATASRKQAQNMNYALSIRQACRILDVIRKDADPSPPIIRERWITEESGKKSLIIAKSSTQGSAATNFMLGDQIVALSRDKVGPWIDVASPSQLFHESRGALKTLTLRVKRDNRVIELRPDWPPASRILAAKALLISGVVLVMLEDDFIFEIERQSTKLAIGSVEEGSPGENIGLESRMFVDSVNGKAVASLDDVYSEITRIKNSGGLTAKFQLRVPDMKQNQIFSYWIRDLSLEEIRWLDQAGSTQRHVSSVR